jgi:hypothetical protein
MINIKDIPETSGIYKITSPSGKIYIGQSINLRSRYKLYRRLASNIKPQIAVYRSLLKYGFDVHNFDIIEECSEDKLNERERYWQDYYEVLKYGLNCTLTKTDSKSGTCSELTKKRKSEAAPTHPIKQYNLNGNFVRDWDRIIDVEKELGIANQTITSCCKGRKDSAGGFIWRYQDSPVEMLENIKSVKSIKYGIPVLQCDLQGNFIKEWNSITKAKQHFKGDILGNK